MPIQQILLATGGSSVNLSANYWFTRIYNNTGSGTMYNPASSVAIDNKTGSVFFGGLNKLNTNITTESATIGKLNIDGTLAWVRSLGSGNGGNDEVSSLACDSSGNVYAVGHCTNGSITTGGTDIFFFKYDTDGNLQWQRLLGHASGTPNEFGRGIVIDSSDNIFIGGYGENATVGTTGGAIIAKYNTSGTLQWNYNYADVWHRQYYNRGISLDSSGNIYFGGQQYDIYGGSQGFVGKVNSSGTFQWMHTDQNSGSGSIQGQDVAADSSGNVYLCGLQSRELIYGATGGDDWFLSKFNSSGVLQWTRILGGTPTANAAYSGNDAAYGVSITSTGDIVVGGHVKTNLSYVGSPKLYLVAKYNSSGTLQFQRYVLHNDIGDPNVGNDNYTYDLRLDSLDNIYILGSSDQDIIVAKLPGDGSLTGTTYDSSDLAYEQFTSSAVHANNSYLTEQAGSNFSYSSISASTNSTAYTNSTSTLTSSSITSSLTAKVSTIL